MKMVVHLMVPIPVCFLLRKLCRNLGSVTARLAVGSLCFCHTSWSFQSANRSSWLWSGPHFDWSLSCLEFIGDFSVFWYHVKFPIDFPARSTGPRRPKRMTERRFFQGKKSSTHGAACARALLRFESCYWGLQYCPSTAGCFSGTVTAAMKDPSWRSISVPTWEHYIQLNQYINMWQEHIQFTSQTFICI